MMQQFEMVTDYPSRECGGSRWLEMAKFEMVTDNASRTRRESQCGSLEMTTGKEGQTGSRRAARA
jgi:hypothetical protein